jgi:hypothetical protein
MTLCHCEERRDDAISVRFARAMLDLDCFADFVASQ